MKKKSTKKIVKPNKSIKKSVKIKKVSDNYVIDTKIPLKILLSLTFILLTVFQGKNTFEKIKLYIETIKTDPAQKLSLLLIVKGIYNKKSLFDNIKFSFGLLSLYNLIKELYTIVIKEQGLGNKFLKDKIQQKAISIAIESAIDHFFTKK